MDRPPSMLALFWTTLLVVSASCIGDAATTDVADGATDQAVATDEDSTDKLRTTLDKPPTKDDTDTGS